MEPHAVTLSVAPGDTVRELVKLENNSQQSQTFVFEIVGVTFGTSADELIFQPLSSTQAAWISIGTEIITIEPDSSDTVEIGITPTTFAESQVLSFAVIASEQVSDQAGVNVSTGLASLFFVNIGEVTAPELRIDEFAGIPSGTGITPVKFAALISNSGAGLAEPEIGVVIKNVWGKEVAIVSLNPTGRRVPGHTDRIFSESWQPDGLRFGPYSAELYVFPDDSATVLTATTNVILFPWQARWGAIAIVAVFLGAVYAFIRWRRKRL